MKNLSKRIWAGLLCVAMLTAMLASCADNEEEQVLVDSNAVTESEEGAPEFEEADFDKKTFTVLSAAIDAEDFGDNYIDNEEINGEPINDAVIDRNRAVEEKYNVDVVVREGGIGDAATAAKAGTVDFEVIYDWGIRLSPKTKEGIFYDFKEIPYIDFSQDYWVPSAQEELTIADKMLIAMCDISMNRIGYAKFIIFNKNLMDDYGVEYPYELVNSNQWTVDKYYEILLDIGGTDVNGDTLWDVGDVYAGSVDGSLANMAVNGSGMRADFLKKNDDGSYTVNVYSDKLVSIFSKYDALRASTPEGVFQTHGWDDFIEGRDISMYDSKYQAGRVFDFGEGHTVFNYTSMAYLTEFVTMEQEYGVVPNPKNEPSDEGYYHYIDVCAPMFAVIKQADMDFVGIIMEYMAYESQQRLLPAFYEQTIKTKTMTDIDGRDEPMLDLIYNGIHIEWTALYGVKGAIENSERDGWNPTGTMYDEMMAAGNFASVNKRYLASAQDSIDKFYDYMLDLDVNR